MSSGIMKSHKNPSTGPVTIIHAGEPLRGYLEGNLPSGVTLYKPLPTPLLHLGINAEGKMDAEYDPDKLTEAARALLAEVARLQEGA